MSEEIWQEESVDYSTLRIFSCPAYSLVESQKRNKLESKSKRCYFISFTKRTKTYKFWDLEKKSAFVSRDVIFDEELMLQEKSKMEDNVQGETLDSLTDSQSKEFEF